MREREREIHMFKLNPTLIYSRKKDYWRELLLYSDLKCILYSELSKIKTWDDKVLHRIVDCFLNIRFPILLVLNKADKETATDIITRYGCYIDIVN